LVNGIIAIVLGYLLGSIPTSYIVARITAGKSRLKVGNNLDNDNDNDIDVLREVRILPTILVGIADVGKGAAAVAIAYWVLDVSPLAVMLTGLAVVVGHMWMVFLKFSGSRAMGATFGALAILLPVYGYWHGFFIFLGVHALPLMATGSAALSLGIGLLFLPLIMWLTTKSILATVLAVLLGILTIIKLWPAAREDWVKNENTRGFVFDDSQNHRRRNV